MRHYCCICNKLFDEKDMILHVYLDGQDWFCKSCKNKSDEKVDEFHIKYEEWAKDQG